VFGVPREQPFRVELHGQQIWQFAGGRWRQFQGLNYVISANRGDT
jgi:hypothetical protein